MKLKARSALCLLLALTLLSPVASRSQQFQNLDFESANLPSVPNFGGGPVPVSEGLPGWTAYLGTVQQTDVLHNVTYNTLASVDILGPTWTKAPEEPGIIGGNYSVYLQAGYQGVDVTASIEQTGTVPVGSESIQFKAWEMFGGSFSVSFNGNNLPLTVLGTGQSPSGQPYNLYGVNIAPYAGETGLLDFTESINGGLSLLLDDINFSTSSVPEPSPALLVALGGLIFAIFQRKKASR